VYIRSCRKSDTEVRCLYAAEVSLRVDLAVVLFVVAAGAVVLSANAVVRHRTKGIPLDASGKRYQIYAGGSVLMAAACSLEGLAELRNEPLLGLAGSILMLAGIGLTFVSRRAAQR
jgi:hypothetical protein